jgi:hypothetical protein
MRTLPNTTFALGLALLLAGLAVAKEHSRYGAHFLLNKSVQQELKLDQGQIDKITVALKKVHDEHKADFAKLRDRNVPKEERAALAGKIAKASKKAVKGILKPEQAKRFAQVRLQMAGVHAFVSPKVQKALKLTDAQKAELQAIDASFEKERQAMFQSAKGKGHQAFQQMVALRQEKMAAAMKVLTDEQKKAWNELTGAPFHMTFGPRQKGS